MRLYSTLIGRQMFVKHNILYTLSAWLVYEDSEPYDDEIENSTRIYTALQYLYGARVKIIMKIKKSRHRIVYTITRRYKSTRLPAIIRRLSDK